MNEDKETSLLLIRQEVSVLEGDELSAFRMEILAFPRIRYPQPAALG